MKISLPKQKYPALSPQGFLERAFMWLDSEIDIGLFYSGLELRKYFEQIWLKHAMTSSDYSDEFTALNWKPHILRDKLSREFISQISPDKAYKFTFDPANPNLTMGYFLPMPDALFAQRKRTNEFVHAQWAIPIRASDRQWYTENHGFLLDFALDLIPHASDKNSLIKICAPNIQAVEVDTASLKTYLKSTLPNVDGPWC